MKNFRQIIFFIVLTVSLPSAINAQKEELKLEILNGHSGGGVLAVAVSSDGKFALTGSTDQTALLWDLETGKQLRRFFGYHEDAISAVQFSKDGRFVLTASHDGSAQLWETATGKRIRGFGENRGGVLIKHSGKILSAAISADMKLVATAGEDRAARIWDFETGKQLFELRHAGRVNSTAFSPDSRFLLTGGEDKIAHLFSTKTGKEERQFVGHTKEIASVAYSHNGKEILTGSDDETARLWNSATSDEVKLFKVETKKIDKRNIKKISAVNFTQTGRAIVASEGEIIIWDIILDKKTSIEFYGIPLQMAITPNEEKILYTSKPSDYFGTLSATILYDSLRAGYYNFVKVVDILSQESKERLIGESYFIRKISPSPDFRNLLTSGTRLCLWKLDGGQIKPQLEEALETKGVNPFSISDDVIYSRDGKKLAVAKQSEVYVFDAYSLDILFSYEVIKPAVVDFSSDGEFLLIGNHNLSFAPNK